MRLKSFKSYTVVLNIQAVGKNLTRHSSRSIIIISTSAPQADSYKKHYGIGILYRDLSLRQQSFLLLSTERESKKCEDFLPPYAEIAISFIDLKRNLLIKIQ